MPQPVCDECGEPLEREGEPTGTGTSQGDEDVTWVCDNPDCDRGEDARPADPN